MSDHPAGPAKNNQEEISALVLQLHEVQERLQELVGEEVDAVVHPGGHSYLLRKAQKKLRESEAAQRELAFTHSSILNALPANIALLDSSGVVLSVNSGWRRFASENHLRSPDSGIALNYLDICARARGTDSEEAIEVEAGIRGVLEGNSPEYSIEYPCHSPTNQRWYRLNVSPIDLNGSRGAVVMHVNVTTRKLAEDAVLAREQSMAAAQSIAHFGSWELDLENPEDVTVNSLRWSAEMFRIAGFKPDSVAISNKLFFSIIPEDEHQSIRAAMRAAIAGHKPYSLIHRIIRNDGEIRFVHEIGQVYFHERTGKPTKMLGTAHDITDRRRAEEKLLQQQIELRVLFDLVPAMIWFKDTEDRILRVNKRVAETAGKSIEELEGKPAAEIYPETAAAFYADDLKVIRSGKPKLGSIQTFRTPQGEEGWLQTDKVPCYDKDGLVSGIVVMSHDITARKHDEEALRESEARFAAAFEQAPIGIALVLPDGKWLKVNHALCALLGYSETELLSCEVQSFIHPDELSTNKEEALQLLAGDISSYQLENRYLHKDGHTITALLNISLVRDVNQEPLYFVSHLQDITARRKTEVALRESEFRYRSLFENMQEGFAHCRLIFDEQGPIDFVYLSVNLAFEKLSGLKNVVGKRVSEVLPDFIETNPDLMKSYCRAAQTGEPEYTESYVPTLNSWYAVSTYSYEKDHFVIVFDNITERKLAENALKDSIEKFNQLASNITDVFWIRSPDMREVQYVSPGFEKLWGRSVESLYAHPERWPEYLLPADRDRVLAAYDSLANGEIPAIDIEYNIVRPDGEVRCVHARGFQVCDATGKVIRHTGVVTDITERKKVEDEIRFKNVLLSIQQEAAIDGILVVDGDRQIQTYNQRFLELWEVPESVVETASDATLLDFVISKIADPEDFLQTVSYLYDQPRELSRDEIKLVDGRVFDRNSAPLFGENDHYYGRAWFFRDVTESKQHEKQILDSNAELDRRVSERTLALANANIELQSARVEADRANQAKSEFLSRVSHELRTPLNSTIGFAQILRRGKLDARQTECVDHIMTAGNHLLSLINEVLEITQIEAGRLSNNPEQISVPHLAKETVGLMRPMAETQKIRIDIPAEPTTPLLVNADPHKLKQVLLNLLGNAVLYNHEGGTVKIDWIQTTSDTIRFTVTDSGPGIPQNQIALLFTPFERLNAAKRGIAGTGLGLVVSRRIIETMGGQIGVQSEVGIGSTFWFEIPINPIPEEEIDPL